LVGAAATVRWTISAGRIIFREGLPLRLFKCQSATRDHRLVDILEKCVLFFHFDSLYAAPGSAIVSATLSWTRSKAAHGRKWRNNFQRAAPKFFEQNG
jgi:hypothetical protein